MRTGCPVVDLGNDEGNFGIHPEGRGVVDNCGSSLDEATGMFLGTVPSSGEQGDVDIVRIRACEILHLDIAPSGGYDSACRAVGGHQPQLGDRETPLLENGDHRSPDSPGSTHNSNVCHAPTSSDMTGGSNSSCRAFTAAST